MTPNGLRARRDELKAMLSRLAEEVKAGQRQLLQLHGRLQEVNSWIEQLEAGKEQKSG